MSCFFYYVPGVMSVDAEAVDRLGLRDRIDKFDVGVVNANGPDGGHGVIICDRSYDVPPRMSMPFQEWRPAPKRGADVAPYWIGFWKDKRPTEESLRRPKMLAGNSIELRDGATWTVPKLVQFDGKSEATIIQYAVRLPQVLDVDDDGEIVSGKIDPVYQSLWDEGWRAHESLTQQAAESGRAVMTVQEARRFAFRLMGVNYRVSPIEIAILALLDDSLPMAIVCSAIDNETFWAAVKNRVGRLANSTTDSPSGAERPSMESITGTPTSPQLAS